MNLNVSPVQSPAEALKTEQAPGHVQATPRELQAARDFEAIFVRKMLSSLEKTKTFSGEDSSTGSSIYGSMMVGAVADMATQGDGLGLSALVLEALTSKHPERTATTTPEPDPTAKP